MGSSIFEKGQLKAGGRGIGTRNKPSLIRDLLAAIDVEPIVEILEAIDELQPRERLGVWIKLLPYCYPQLKSVEITSSEPNGGQQASQAAAADIWAAARKLALPEIDDKSA